MLIVGQAQARPVVVELFTSQACSSCPPADVLLGQLKAGDAGILPLSFNVTYWNGPAWMDKDSLTAATDRQTWYAGLQHSDTVYTPEAVVDGGAAMVGSNRPQLLAAIAAAKAASGLGVPVSIDGGQMITVHVGNGTATQAETIWLFGYDGMHTTRIGGGENGGATLTEVNVVRSITSLGAWSGINATYNISRPAGEHMAVVVQGADGKVDGAGTD